MDAAIIAAVTAVATALAMTTVGEGIETIAEFAALQSLGCDDRPG